MMICIRRLPQLVASFLVASVAIAPSLNAADSTNSTSARPNILVLSSDEHNASILGCYGNKLSRTPNLDRLAANGVVFERAYCNAPLCVPSRQSFTGGKYCSRVGAWNNNCRMPADSPSLPRVMNAAGYESYLCGKMHYDANCRYGFTEIGGNMNNAQMSGLGKRRAADDLKTKPGYSERFAEFATGETSHNMKHDQNVTAGVTKFLKERSPDQKPFFLLAGFLTPHFPLIVPTNYWAHYQDKIPMPVIPDGYLDTLPLNYKHLRVSFHEENVPPDLVKKGRELYYGLTEWMDNEAGKIFAALAASPFATNTVIIYTTDHGENMGDHGLWWKSTMYEESARVPLIVSWPARWPGGQRRTQACSLVDVAQTIAQLGDAKVPTDWNGTSMVNWLDHPNAPWKDQSVTEYYAHNVASGFVMIRSGDYKYVYHTAPDAKHPAERELYNLKTDPAEMHNLAADPANKALIQKMHAALVKEVGEDPEITEKRCREELAKGYGVAAKGKGKKKKTDDE